MTASAVSIARRALQILGAGTLTALTDDNEKGRALTIAYEPVRDAELDRRTWKFSIKRTSLAALAGTPDSDFLYWFQLPNDYIRLLEGGDIISLADTSDYRNAPSAPYSVENGKLLTNFPAPLAIRYVAKVTDVSLYPPSFCEALAARLAYECCYRITESTAKENSCLERYGIAIKEARQARALETASQGIQDDTWTLVRTQ